LSTPTGDPAFDPEPITREEAEEWRRDILRQIEGARAALRRTTPPSMLPTSDMIEQQLAGLERLSRDGVMRIRVHGDYHLGQVLRTHGGFTVLDFEGEPARPLAQRRKKLCALKDVAGMLRSFSYVTRFAVREPGHRAEASRDAMHGWEERAAERFLDGYLAQARPGHACFLPRDRAGVEDVLRAFLIEKAAYEVAYEANNRPTWLDIPIEGLRKFTPA
jgi:trehalose synthase-fused probable maltokinase